MQVITSLTTWAQDQHKFARQSFFTLDLHDNSLLDLTTYDPNACDDWDMRSSSNEAISKFLETIKLIATTSQLSATTGPDPSCNVNELAIFCALQMGLAMKRIDYGRRLERWLQTFRRRHVVTQAKRSSLKVDGRMLEDVRTKKQNTAPELRKDYCNMCAEVSGSRCGHRIICMDHMRALQQRVRPTDHEGNHASGEGESFDVSKFDVNNLVETRSDHALKANTRNLAIPCSK